MLLPRTGSISSSDSSLERTICLIGHFANDESFVAAKTGRKQFADLSTVSGSRRQNPLARFLR